jgi:hypothetical protein
MHTLRQDGGDRLQQGRREGAVAQCVCRESGGMSKAWENYWCLGCIYRYCKPTAEPCQSCSGIRGVRWFRYRNKHGKRRQEEKR